MAESILFVAHLDESGMSLPRVALEALGTAVELALQGNKLTIGLIGGNVQSAAEALAGIGVEMLGVAGAEFEYPRYASDAGAIEAIFAATAPSIVIAPGTSRFMRVVPGVAQRVNGQVDTHITALESIDGGLAAKRWLYRQRMEASVRREARPWFLVLDSGCHGAWSGVRGKPEVKMLDVTLPEAARRTSFKEIRTPSSSTQTIRP